jgi:hypothetical protein
MKCKCGQRLNTAYVYRKKKGKGVWDSVGFYCTECGRFYGLKKLRLHESIRTSAKMT